MSKIDEIIMHVMSGAMIIILLMVSISSQALNIDNYTKAQEKANVAQVMKLPQEEVTEATLVALGYTRGITEELTYVSETRQEDIFSRQDKEHMIDVRDLYGLLYSTIIAMTSILMLFSTYLLINRKHIGIFNLAQIFNKTSFYFLSFVAIIGFFALINFTLFWNTFHKIFFDNDLWLMDPSRDALIQMMPESLFSSLVFKIFGSFFSFLLFFNLVAWWYKNFKVKEVEI